MILTFDVYGTLFDWSGSIGSYLRYIGAESEAFFKAEYAAVSKRTAFKKYSDVLKESLSVVMGPKYTEEYGEGLVLAFAKSPPFPDVLLGLRRLKQLGHRLGVISNTERALLKITLAGLENLFDWVVTAEDTKHYKPAPEAFTEAYRLMGVVGQDILHVSSYPQYDLETASRLGLKTVLVDRYGYSWRQSVADLVELASKLAANQAT